MIKFSDISLDLSILDRYNYLIDSYLTELDEEGLAPKYNIYDIPFKDYRFDEFMNFKDLLEIWVMLAENYFREEYLEEYTREELDRQRLYLQELELIKKYWLKGEE